MGELYSLADSNKVSGSSFILLSDGGLFVCVYIMASGFVFNRSVTNNSASYIQTLNVYNGGGYEYRAMSSSGITYQNVSSAKMAGYARLYY